MLLLLFLGHLLVVGVIVVVAAVAIVIVIVLVVVVVVVGVDLFPILCVPLVAHTTLNFIMMESPKLKFIMLFQISSHLVNRLSQQKQHIKILPSCQPACIKC